MKQDFRSHAVVKAIALLLAVACAVGAAFGWFYSLSRWGTLFEQGDFQDSPAWSQAHSDNYSTLMRVLEWYDQLRQGEETSYLDQKYYDEALASLDPAVTNFRYIIRDNDTGEILISSAGEESLDHVFELYRHSRTFSSDKSPAAVTDYNWLYDGDTNQVFFSDGSGNLLFTVSGYLDGPYYDQEQDLLHFYNEDGELAFQLAYDTGEGSTPGVTRQYAVEYGVDGRLPVADAFRAARDSFTRGDIRVLYWAVGLTVAFLILTVFLMCCAGRRPGAETFILNWSDKIPYDLYLFAMGCAGIFACGMGISLLLYSYRAVFLGSGDYVMLFSGSALCFTATAAIGEAAVMSTATRIKAHTLLRNTLTWRLCFWCWRLCGKMWQGCRSFARSLGATVGSIPLTGRVVAFSLGYLMLNAFLAWGLFRSYESGFYLLLLFLFNGFALFLICRWTVQWQNLRQGAQAIVGGQPDTVIDTTDMTFFPDLRTHAEALNDLGSAINTAVEERLKSERMKAELITNVSHDLKTPLTSIINYVDLLKKEDIQGEKAQEYIEVLDRKSQRLKKLTEDLVEASKASTGTLTVNTERLGMIQLVEQALGEYTAKFEEAGLTLISTLPEQEAYVTADGRHLWRIVDNLLGNCVKYAMPGTRVYLDMTVWDGWVTLSLKNISAQQLNIPADQLMERFVRGDESRTTEGSGLGLSIARSLTDLQGGKFRLEVDGDLFKAVVSLPQA